jgi:hypothetical protein
MAFIELAIRWCLRNPERSRTTLVQECPDTRRTNGRPGNFTRFKMLVKPTISLPHFDYLGRLRAGAFELELDGAGGL